MPRPRIELSEYEIDSFPAGRELDILVNKLVMLDSYPENAILYSTVESSSDSIIPILERVNKLYQVTEWESQYDERGIPIDGIRHFVKGFDGLANPWGWGETKQLSRCRFALKTILYQQNNRDRGLHDPVDW